MISLGTQYLRAILLARCCYSRQEDGIVMSATRRVVKANLPTRYGVFEMLRLQHPRLQRPGGAHLRSDRRRRAGLGSFALGMFDGRCFRVVSLRLRRTAGRQPAVLAGTGTRSAPWVNRGRNGIRCGVKLPIRRSVIPLQTAITQDHGSGARVGRQGWVGRFCITSDSP